MSSDEAPNPDNWDDIAQWWLAEISDDPIYASDVHPLYQTLVEGAEGSFLDLGCGNGQGMELVPGPVVGVDLSERLLIAARSHGPVLRGKLPSLAYLQSGSFDHAGAIYLLDLIADHEAFFEEVARVVRSGGTLAIVINHPIYTAPGSAPIADIDGEVLWRWGQYHARGSSHERAGERSVEFFHRPIDDLVTSAAAGGWCLEMMVERPLSSAAIEGEPGYLGQDAIPRLLGVRWRLPEGS
jgi:SAM-dependent methyltransferase